MDNYKALKTAAKVAIALKDDVLTITKKQYDMDTGEALDDAVSNTTVSLQTNMIDDQLRYIEKQTALLATTKESLELMKTDIDALK